MAGDFMRFRNPAGHRGLLSNLLGAANALAAFVESRLGLFGHEARSALVQFVVLGVCLVLAAILCACGFIFLMVSLIAGLAHVLHISWIWVAVAVAFLQFVLALFCALIARSRMTKPIFRESLAELKKDRAWLKNLEKTNHSPR